MNFREGAFCYSKEEARIINNNQLKRSDTRLNLLKWIALITMLIDHIGAILFPSVVWLRIIGRIAFPIYAYLIAEGSIRTGNKKRYSIRLLQFAFISQIPYILAFNSITPNILFTLVIGLIFIQPTFKNLIILFAISVVVPVEYGFFGLLLPLFFIYSRNATKLGFFIITSSLLIYSVTTGSVLQPFAVMGIVLVFLIPPLKLNSTFSVNRWFFYWFYPVHLIVLVIIKFVYYN